MAAGKTPGARRPKSRRQPAAPTIGTARVPASLQAAFVEAERLVKSYFGKRIDDPTQGRIEIAGERYVLVRAAALSVEFFALVEKLYGAGREREADEFARNILFDLAHAVGKSDAATLLARLEVTDRAQRLAAGPVHFAHAGWALVDLSSGEMPESGPGYLLVYDHPWSFESDAWSRAGRRPDFPVCIMNAGYSSGWCEESLGQPLVAIEVLCRAKGDDCCRFIMAPPETIEARVEGYIAEQPALAPRIRGYQIPDFFARKRMEEELRAAQNDLEARVADRTAELQRVNDHLRRAMSERERITVELERTRRLESLGRLVGGIAHDFNNLLGVVLGYSSMLERRVPADDPMRGMLSEITQSAQLAADLTRRLLAFGRRQSAMSLPLDANEVIHDLSTLMLRLLGDQVRVELGLDAAPLFVESTAADLQQMVMSLALNARDAMPEGGVITITTDAVPDLDVSALSAEARSAGPASAARTGRGVRIRVTDTGKGMSPDIQAHIFDPFFTTKDDAHATGLGLSSVYGIVVQHGGAIAVESAEGDGTRVVVTLPEVFDVTPESEEQDMAESSRRPVATVMVLDGGGAFRAATAQLIAAEGHRALAAADRREARKLAETNPVDVLLADVEILRDAPLVAALAASSPALRLLLWTHHGEPKPHDLVPPPGVPCELLSRPFAPAALAASLAELLAGARG